MTNDTNLGGLELILTEDVNGVACEFYKGFGFNGAITREKLGAALGYVDPRVAIAKIHRAHKDRLDSRSVVTSLVTTDGKSYNTYVYSLKGALEVCRWSRSPAADLVMDALYEVFEKLLTVGRVTRDELPGMIQQLSSENQEFVFESVIPALQSAQLDQRKVVGDYLGLDSDEIYKGTNIVKKLEANCVAGHTLFYWKEHNEKVYTVEDLPEAMREWIFIEPMLKKLSLQRQNWGIMANYCGKVYFNQNGLVPVINCGIRNKIISKQEGAEWLNAVCESWVYA